MDNETAVESEKSKTQPRKQIPPLAPGALSSDDPEYIWYKTVYQGDDMP